LPDGLESEITRKAEEKKRKERTILGTMN